MYLARCVGGTRHEAGPHQGIRAEGIVRLYFLELLEVLLHGEVDLGCQLMLQNCPGRLKRDMARLHANRQVTLTAD